MPRRCARSDAPAWLLSGERALLVVTPQAATLAGVSQRFVFKYEAGRIVRVTDVDRDGAPEVWIRGTEGECDDPKARPGVNCAIPTIHMGEIRDDALTFFANSKARR